MSEGTVRTKIILEGAEEYKREISDVRDEINRLADSASLLNAEMEKLNESMKAFAELRRSLF